MTDVNIFSLESRTALARMVCQLFLLWEISEADQLNLLVMTKESQPSLADLRAGQALPEVKNIVGRVGWLMSIHKNLGLLYPHNDEIKYTWINRGNEVFDNSSPLEIMKEEGIAGIIRVARYLNGYAGL